MFRNGERGAVLRFGQMLLKGEHAVELEAVARLRLGPRGAEHAILTASDLSSSRTCAAMWSLGT